VFLAEPKDTQGFVLGRNQVLYLDAFEAGSVKADVRYTTTRSIAIEQDVILRERLPSPADFGLAPDKTKLEVWTEFLEAPEPQKHNRTIKRPQGGDESDDDLEFGISRIGSGKAFVIPAENPIDMRALAETPIAKAWHIDAIEGKRFLIESVPYLELKNDLDRLPAPEVRRREFRPSLLLARANGQPRLRPLSVRTAARTADRSTLRMAALDANYRDTRLGLALDYVTVLTQAGLTLKGDTTYFVNGDVYLSGVTVLESAVIKYERYSDTLFPKLLVYGPLICKTSAYREATFTAKDDNTLGENIQGSTGNPTGWHYGWYQLWGAGAQAYEVQHVRFRFSHIPFYVQNNPGVSLLRHAQFYKCFATLYPDGCTLKAQNVLAYDCDNVMRVRYGGTLQGQHITVNKALFCPYRPAGQGPGYVDLINSLLVEITYPDTYTGSNNQTASSGTTVFQTVGGGYNYLANNSYRNQGTSAIDAQLASDIKTRTTYPPLALPSPINSNLTLGPQAQRDTDLPDLGFHYSVLDYLGTEVALNAALSLVNGVAVGFYGINGLKLQNGAVLTSEGTPLNPNRVVRYRTVQENAISASEPYSDLIICQGTYSPTPQVTFRHTVLSLLPSHNGSSLIKSPPSGSMAIDLRDCQLQGGALFTLNTPTLTLHLVNCLFERVNCLLQGSPVNLYNCTFVGGTVSFFGLAGQTYTVKDNLFDGSSMGWQAGTLYNSNNGYTTGTTPLPGGINDKTGLVADYQTGPLGRHYYPANGSPTSLAALQNWGSRYSSQAGLNYHTVRVDQTPDFDWTWVDVGFHYAALPQSGPYYDVDSDGDGVWDGWDYYPSNAASWADPYANPSDVTAPTITLIAPPNVVVLP